MSTFGAFSVVRSTVKRVLNSSGVLAEVAINTPAFEFNTDGTYRGLLVEPAATNLLVRSAEIQTSPWAQVIAGTGVAPVITANAAVAPDGTTTATRILLDRGAGTTVSDASIWNQAVTVTAVAHSFSVWLKSATGGNQVIQLRANSAPLDTITITADWQRFTVVNTPTAGSRQYGFDLRGNTSGASQTADFYAWGAQLELGSVATSYIPTVASTVTRTADSVTLTGASSLIGQTEGTLYAEVEARNYTSGGGRRIINLRTDGNNVITLDASATSSTYLYAVTSGGVDQAGFTSTAIAGTIVRLAGAYKLDDFAFYINGVQIGTDTSGTVPNLATAVIGLGVRADASANTQFNGWIRSVAIFPTRLANATLATLTT